MSSTDFKETEPMNMPHHRLNDPPIRVTREIPMHWLLGIVGTIAVSLVNSYFVQQDQTKQVDKLNTQLEKVVNTLATGSQKSQEHDYKLMDLERRVSALELRQGAKR